MEPIGMVTVVLIIIATAIYSYFKYSFMYWKSRGVPCDEPIIPYGLIKGIGKTTNMSEITRAIYNKYRARGAKFCGLYTLTRPCLLLLDLDLVKNIFIKDFANFDDRNLYFNEADDPLSANLIFLGGEKWKKLRTKLTPTFSSGKMKSMFPIIVGVGESLCETISRAIHKDSQVEVKDIMARFTTDNIGTCAFGIDCNSLTDPDAEFRRYGFKAINKFPRSPVMAFMLTFRNLARKLHMKFFSADVSAFFLNVVRDTIDYREKNNVERNDFMNILITLKNQKDKNPDEGITFNELAAQAFVFFLAGFETTATSLTFLLYEISLNPEIQNKARRIIQEAYKKHNGQLTYEMLLDMPYLEQMLEETLRKYSPTQVLIRKANNDYRVPGTEIILDKGTTVMIPIHGIHYDPEYYPDPEKYDPDRFSSEEKKKRDPMTFLAFGEGPRNCIGMRFAYMQARIALVLLLTNFEFSIGSKTIVPVQISKSTFFVTPQDEIYLEVKPLKSLNRVKTSLIRSNDDHSNKTTWFI